MDTVMQVLVGLGFVGTLAANLCARWCASHCWDCGGTVRRDPLAVGKPFCYKCPARPWDARDTLEGFREAYPRH